MLIGITGKSDLSEFNSYKHSRNSRNLNAHWQTPKSLYNFANACSRYYVLASIEIIGGYVTLLAIY